MQKENRLKIVSLGAQEVLMAFLAMRKELPDLVIVNKLDGVPDDCQVERVYHNYERDCFDFVVSHPTFPLTQPGMQIERVATPATCTVVRIPTIH